MPCRGLRDSICKIGQYTLKIAKDVVVPVAQDPNAFGRQPSTSSDIGQLTGVFAVLAPINFDG